MSSYVVKLLFEDDTTMELSYEAEDAISAAFQMQNDEATQAAIAGKVTKNVEILLQ
jgi:hypothetical protein